MLLEWLDKPCLLVSRQRGGKINLATRFSPHCRSPRRRKHREGSCGPTCGQAGYITPTLLEGAHMWAKWRSTSCPNGSPRVGRVATSTMRSWRSPKRGRNNVHYTRCVVLGAHMCKPTTKPLQSLWPPIREPNERGYTTFGLPNFKRGGGARNQSDSIIPTLYGVGKVGPQSKGVHNP